MFKNGFMSLEWFYNQPPHKAINTPATLETKRVPESPDSVLIDGDISAMFYLKSRPITDAVSAFEKDYTAYSDLYETNRKHLDGFEKLQADFNSAMEKLASPNTTYEQLRAAILKFKTRVAQYDGKNSIAGRYNKVKSSFLGEYQTDFVIDEILCFSGKQELKKKPFVYVTSLSQETLPRFEAIYEKIKSFFDAIEEKRYNLPMGYDMTDSPMRGFISELDDDKEVMLVINPLIAYGVVDEDENLGFYDALKTRLANLLKAADAFRNA